MLNTIGPCIDPWGTPLETASSLCVANHNSSSLAVPPVFSASHFALSPFFTSFSEGMLWEMCLLLSKVTALWYVPWPRKQLSYFMTDDLWKATIIDPAPVPAFCTNTLFSKKLRVVYW